MAEFQAFEVDELIKQHSEQDGAYQEFIRRPSVSMGLYVLPAGGEDLQHPHAADEIYYIVRGRARLNVAGDVRDVQAGSVVSVDQGVEHNFSDIAEDLHVLVVFAPPEQP